MNRNQFLKLLGLLPLSLLTKGNEMPIQTNKYGDMLKEFYQGIKGGTLPETRLNDITREFNELWDRENKYRAFLRVQDGRVNPNALELPVISVYSNVLSKDTQSIVIPVPVHYRNLILIVHGQVNDATLNSLHIQFNGDTGSNYEWQYIQADGTTVSADDSTAYAKVSIFLGQFGTSAADARPGMIVANIPNYASSVWKKVLFSNNYFSENNTLLTFGGIWKSTSPIERLRVFNPNSAVDMVAGSLISLLATL